jgi:hypothetical protein
MNPTSSSLLSPMMLITRTRLEETGRMRSGYCGERMDANLNPNIISSPSQAQSHRRSSVLIYRNVKYIGFFGRMSRYMVTYGRAYFLLPLLNHLRQCHIYLLEFLGFFILLFLSPFLVFLALGKYHW